MTEITFKLPPQIVKKHGDELRAVDWSSKPQHAVKLGEQAYLLEVIQRDYQTIVRPATARNAIALRRYAHSIAPDPKPTPEQLASVLEGRNPPEEGDGA